MDACLAVDPGERAGWAVWFEDHVARSGVVPGDDITLICGLVSTYRSLGVLVVEDQFITTHLNSKGRRQPRNPLGIKTLLFRRHLWEIPARIQGMKVEPINPITWQSFFRLKRGDKASFIRLASTLAERDVDYDEADAVLMAQWWAQQRQAQRAIGG